jgi:hypothetical protein
MNAPMYCIGKMKSLNVKSLCIYTEHCGLMDSLTQSIFDTECAVLTEITRVNCRYAVSNF